MCQASNAWPARIGRLLAVGLVVVRLELLDDLALGVVRGQLVSSEQTAHRGDDVVGRDGDHKDLRGVRDGSHGQAGAGAARTDDVVDLIALDQFAGGLRRSDLDGAGFGGRVNLGRSPRFEVLHPVSSRAVSTAVGTVKSRRDFFIGIPFRGTDN